MSGGYFNYDEQRLKYIRDAIVDIIKNNNKEREPEGSWERNEAEENGTKFYHSQWNDNTIKLMKVGVVMLEHAFAYAKAIDYLVEGDIGEDDLNEYIIKYTHESLKETEEMLATE